MVKRKRTDNDLQNTTQKTKDQIRELQYWNPSCYFSYKPGDKVRTFCLAKAHQRPLIRN